MKTCTTAHCFNYNSNTKLISLLFICTVIECFNIVCVHSHIRNTDAKIHTQVHPLMHRLSHLDFPFMLSCVGHNICFEMALYLIFFYCFRFPPILTTKELCIFNLDITFWRCFATTFFFNVPKENFLRLSNTLPTRRFSL